jgi:hypothetical protein
MVTLHHWYNVFPIHLHAPLGCGEFYEGGPRVGRPPVKWSTIAESLRNTVLLLNAVAQY